MARKVETKALHNTRLLKEYASWIYCTACGRTVAYLCYVTYDRFDFAFRCNCGCDGRVHIDFEDSKPPKESSGQLLTIKNRLCCPADSSPLVTVMEKNIGAYKLRIQCANCDALYFVTRETP